MWHWLWVQVIRRSWKSLKKIVKESLKDISENVNMTASLTQLWVVYNTIPCITEKGKYANRVVDLAREVSRQKAESVGLFQPCIIRYAQKTVSFLKRSVSWSNRIQRKHKAPGLALFKQKTISHSRSLQRKKTQLHSKYQIQGSTNKAWFQDKKSPECGCKTLWRDCKTI